MTMKNREPVFEKSRSVQDMQHMRLMALLDELVRDKGVMKACQALGVDYKTLTESLKRGRLSRRMRKVLGKALLEGGGSPAAEQRERNDTLEERLKEVEGRVGSLAKGLATIRGDLKALGDGHDRGMRRLSELETGRAGRDEGRADGANARPRGRRRPRREYPDLVTLEPADDDEEVFGDAWPLIARWRELKATHPNRGKGLDWLRTEERLLATELELLEERGMTLPPETYPLRDFARNGQITWRRTALSDTRRALRKREILRRVLTLGLWKTNPNEDA